MSDDSSVKKTSGSKHLGKLPLVFFTLALAIVIAIAIASLV